MKVKAIIDCDGIGYKDFKKDEVRELQKEIEEKLLDFGYVEEIMDLQEEPIEVVEEPEKSTKRSTKK